MKRNALKYDVDAVLIPWIDPELLIGRTWRQPEHALLAHVLANAIDESRGHIPGYRPDSPMRRKVERYARTWLAGKRPDAVLTVEYVCDQLELDHATLLRRIAHGAPGRTLASNGRVGGRYARGPVTLEARPRRRRKRVRLTGTEVQG